MNKNETVKSNKSSHNNGNERIIEEHLDLLKKVVEEFKNSGEPEEELSQVGYIGLLNAVNIYKDQKIDVFQEHARHLIAGEIRCYIREKHKKVKVPDWLSVMMNKLLNQMLMAYCKQYERFPNFEELAQMLDLSPEMLKEALKTREAVIEVSIDQKRRKHDIHELPDTLKIKKAIERGGNE